MLNCLEVRSYRLGKRQGSSEQTRQRIVAAARQLVASGRTPSVGRVAAVAGVSRITVYNQFGSRAGLLQSLLPDETPGELAEAPPREQLRNVVADSCARWAADPALYRNLPPARSRPAGAERPLAERLAATDELRPGCSIKEAEDVIGVLTSFPVFDALHHDGRRAPAAVTEILMRLAGGILAYHP